MPTLHVDVPFVDSDVWMTRAEAANGWGIHLNTVSRSRAHIPADDVLDGGYRWWIRRDTDWRPHPVGRPKTTGKCWKRRHYYIHEIPFVPDLRTLAPGDRTKYYVLIDRLVEAAATEAGLAAFQDWFADDTRPWNSPDPAVRRKWVPEEYDPELE